MGDLFEYLSSGLRVTSPWKIHSLMKKNGVRNLNEFIALCDEERDELLVELKNGGVVLGDRSKIRKSTPQSIATWTTLMKEEKKLDKGLLKRMGMAVSKIFGSTDGSSDPGSEHSSTDSATDSARLEGTSRRFGSRNYPKGSPAWWKEHDVRIRRLALQLTDGKTTYPWQAQHASVDYHQLLWERRAELLASGFAKEDAMRKEWLALVLELDRTANQCGPTLQRSTNEDYPWFSHRAEAGYKKLLLQRRTQMLNLNLTRDVSLQTEWVLLMRELECAVKEQGSTSCDSATISNGLSVPAVTVTDDNTVPQPGEAGGPEDCIPQNTPFQLSTEVRGLKGACTITQWRTEVARTLHRSDSKASLLSEPPDFNKADIERVASLASFYADSTRTEDFYTGSENESIQDEPAEARETMQLMGEIDSH